MDIYFISICYYHMCSEHDQLYKGNIKFTRVCEGIFKYPKLIALLYLVTFVNSLLRCLSTQVNWNYCEQIK